MGGIVYEIQHFKKFGGTEVQSGSRKWRNLFYEQGW